MQPILKNKRTLLSASLLLAMSNASMATDETFDISALTIQDIKITEEQSIDFGQTITGKAASTCSMFANGQDEVIHRADLDGDNSIDADPTFGNLTGGGCINGTFPDVFPGVYLLTGEAGSEVSITVSQVVDTDFTFNPGLGCAVKYSNDGAADPCDAINLNTAVKVFLPLAESAEVTTTATGTMVAGESRITLGGTLSMTNDMTDNGTGYSAVFDITVTYE